MRLKDKKEGLLEKDEESEEAKKDGTRADKGKRYKKDARR